MSHHYPIWVAHRGQTVNYPENTLASINAALRCGAEYIEVDIQCSADGELFLMHDAVLNRTTGLVGNLLQMKADHLRCISAHEPDRFGDTFMGECIPRLSELATLITDWPHVSMFVEIKQESITAHGVDSMLNLIESVLDPVRSQCILISFSLPFIQAVKQRSIFTAGWILDCYDEAIMHSARSLNPEYLVIDYMKVAREKCLASGNWQWMLYEINDADIAAKCVALNVQLVETSHICGMLNHHP